MICIIVTCAIVAGTAKTCEPGTMSTYYINAPAVIKDMRECREAFKTAPMESGRRRVAVDQIPSTNEFLRGK